ncbi:MAG: ATP-binding protein [bacterium]
MTATSESPASIFSSMRLQLTFWYTAVLAIVLLIFAVTTYFYLAGAARRRTDQSLQDTFNSLVSTFNSELTDEHQSADNAVTEAVHSFQFRDRQLIVFDDRGVVVGSSKPQADLQLTTDWFKKPEAHSQLTSLLEPTAKSGRTFSTIVARNEAVRVLAGAVPADSKRYTFIIANPLREEGQALEQARKAFYVAVPLALLIAALGGYFLARKSLQPVVTMGEQAARIGVSTLSHRIPIPRHNQELGRLAVIFNDLLLRLDQSFAQQRQFMADASHELRTPVAVVSGESEVALSQPERDSDEYRQSLAIIHDEGRRLTRMVDDLFILARADTGEYPLLLEDFYLDESLSECVRSMRSLAGQKGLAVHYEPPQQEIAFRGDEALIRRMVLNLIHNAIKYTPAHGQVTLRLTEASDRYEIAITDTGSGIPFAAQSQVFDRFFRADKARSREEFLSGSGAGLGLSIAQWAAELHGGQIVLERSDATGSTFIISLPTRTI